VNCNRYLLYSLHCSSSSQIFLQSISPRFSEDLALYFMEVRLRSRDAARWSLSSPSRVVQQLCMRLCNAVEHTIRSSMWLSAMPELVGLLLVQVLCPGLPDFVSKKVFILATDALGRCVIDFRPSCCV
jgi:hypothetical protein